MVVRNIPVWLKLPGFHNSEVQATILLNSALTIANTESQSLGDVCLKSRADGYQGVVFPSPHFQSGEWCSSTQTRLPNAPARCATAVSEVIIRSRAFINPEVFSKLPFPVSIIGKNFGNGGADLSPFCKLNQVTPEILFKLTIRSIGSWRNFSTGFSGFPLQFRPTLRPEYWVS